MDLSVVTTMYYSAPYLKEFYRRICETAEQITDDFEIIFVNDGSPDESLGVALELHQADPRVCVVDLSRNFGHHKAMMTGLHQSTGDLIFLIDCDLELPPEVLQEFYKQLQQQKDVDVIYGVQETRQDPWLRRKFSELYYTIFNLLSDTPLPRNLLTVRLMTRRYLDKLLEYRETVFIIAALWAHTGFKQVAIPLQKTYKGHSSYRLIHNLRIIVKSIVVFSNKPLLYIAVLGFLITFAAMLYLIWILYGVLFLGYGATGWNSLIVSIWFMGGLNIFVLGIIAVYLSVIFAETKQRPYTIVREVYQRPPHGKI